MNKNEFPPMPQKYYVDPQLWEAAKLKAQQLEREIKASTATTREKSNMLHSLSKLVMFAGDAANTRL